MTSIQYLEWSLKCMAITFDISENSSITPKRRVRVSQKGEAEREGTKKRRNAVNEGDMLLWTFEVFFVFGLMIKTKPSATHRTPIDLDSVYSLSLSLSRSLKLGLFHFHFWDPTVGHNPSVWIKSRRLSSFLLKSLVVQSGVVSGSPSLNSLTFVSASSKC